MKDIDKQIKKVARLFRESLEPYGNLPIDITEGSFRTGANFVLDKWKEAERWRDVNEELPEEKKDCRIDHAVDRKSDSVLVKTKLGCYDVAVYNYYYEDFIANSTALIGVTHWKPIKEY